MGKRKATITMTIIVDHSDDANLEALEQLNEDISSGKTDAEMLEEGLASCTTTITLEDID